MPQLLLLSSKGIGTKTDGAPEEYMTYGHNQVAASSSYYAYSMALH